MSESDQVSWMESGAPTAYGSAGGIVSESGQPVLQPYGEVLVLSDLAEL